MHYREQLKERAAKALDKKAALGDDLDLSQYDKTSQEHQALAEGDLLALSPDEQNRLVMAGVVLSGDERAGTYIQKDRSVIHCKSKQEGVEVIPVRKALEEYDWLEEYYWKLVAVDTDKYTAAVEADPESEIKGEEA